MHTTSEFSAYGPMGFIICIVAPHIYCLKVMVCGSTMFICENDGLQCCIKLPGNNIVLQLDCGDCKIHSTAPGTARYLYTACLKNINRNAQRWRKQSREFPRSCIRVIREDLHTSCATLCCGFYKQRNALRILTYEWNNTKLQCLRENWMIVMIHTICYLSDNKLDSY